MKTSGVYYIESVDRIILITKCEYYEDLYNKPFSIVNWTQETETIEKVLITQEQFKRFKKIGEL